MPPKLTIEGEEDNGTTGGKIKQQERDADAGTGLDPVDPVDPGQQETEEQHQQHQVQEKGKKREIGNNSSTKNTQNIRAKGVMTIKEMLNQMQQKGKKKEQNQMHGTDTLGSGAQERL